MSDPVERPARPQYGEYATPDEQRRRIQQPDATWALETGSTIEGSSDPDQTAPAEAPAPATTQAAPRRRLGDRIATIALLAYGFFTVVSTIPSLFDYSAYVDTAFGLWGIDAEYTGGAAAAPWAASAGFVLAVGWIAAAWLSWRSLAKGRVTWWIPLVAGVLCTMIAGVLLVVPLMSDPGVRDVFTGLV